jgi:GTP-binding protein
MRVLAADFETSAAEPRQFPVDDEGAELPEVAFVGRSNVGKSTLLQALTGRRGLVRTSNTPGRTRLCNFFTLRVAAKEGAERRLRFVDLPGYGFAKVAKSERAGWFAFIERYLGGRAQLRVAILLVDARRGPELDETELARYIVGRGVAVIPVVTKADKLAKHERRPIADAAARALVEAVAPDGPERRALLGRPLVVSATERTNIDELWARILDCV